MKKITLTALTSIMIMFGITNSYADIWVGSYSGAYVPKAGHYYGVIRHVLIGTSSETGPDGNDSPLKHDYVYVETTNDQGENLEFDFSKDDLQNGLAMFGAIGKNIDVTLDLDKKSNIVVHTLSAG